MRFNFARNRYIATSSEIKTLGLLPTCANGRDEEEGRKEQEYISRETLPPNHLKCPVNSFENYAWIIAKPRIRERFSSRVSRLDQTMDRFAFAWRRFVALQTDQNLNEFFNLFEVGLESKKF